MSGFAGWQSNPYVFAVQSKNYILDGFKKFANLYINQSHFIFPKGVADLSEGYQVSAQNLFSQANNFLTDINNGCIRVVAKSNTKHDRFNPQSDKDTWLGGSNDARGMRWEGVGFFYDGNAFQIVNRNKNEIRFCPIIMKLSEYVNSIKSQYGDIFYKSNFLYKPSYTFNGGYYVEADNPNNYDDCYVLTGVDFYVLSGGKYQKTSDYIDIYTPIRRTYTRWNIDLNKYTTNIFVPYLTSLLPYTLDEIYGLSRGFVLTTIFDNFYQFVLTKFPDEKTRFIFWSNIDVGDLPEDEYNEIYRYQKLFYATTKDNWTKIFNGAGLAWSYKSADVINPDGDVNTPIYPGQPTNPTGGGGGTGDNISDEIPMPTPSFLPNNTAYNRYWLKGSDISNLQSFLFSDTFLNNIKRLWTDPAEYMIKLAYYPFDGVAHDYNGTANATVSIGGIASEISAYAMLNNYNNKFFGGTINIEEYYGTYLDYSPYTTAEIYIPYIGYRQINLSDVMGKTLEIQYAVDFDTGILTAFVLSDSTPLTMYSAPFGVEVALSGSNANQVAQSVLGMVGDVVSAAGGVVSLITSAGASAPVAIPQITGAAGNLVNQVMNLDISPRNFGSPSPTTALYAPQQPFIVLHRPITAEPADFAALNGYAAGYSGLVSSFSGYLKASSVKLSYDTKVSQAEQQEIISLLLGGVYIG